MRFLPLSFLVLVISCGSKENSSSGVSPIITLGEPAQMVYQNESCSGQRAQVMGLNDFNTIFLQYSNLVYKTRVPLREVMSGKKLISPKKDVIHRTYFQERTVQYQDIKNYQLTDTDVYYLLNKGKDLEACANKDYERYTYEGAAFGVIAAINMSQNEIVKHDYKLSTVELNIIPSRTIKGTILTGPKSGKGFKSFVVDNASYSPNSRKITIFPQSLEKYENKNIPYWEMPFVSSHEYGHHVFYELSNSIKYFKNHNDISQSIQHTCFLNNSDAIKVNKKREKYIGKKRTKWDKFKFALGSINEGFADLIAYYTLDQSLTDVSVVGCFKKNRQIDSKTFLDGSEKKFSYNILTKVDYKSGLKPPTNCRTPDYQEVHDVGAIFSYVSNNMMEEFKLTKDQKLSVLLKVAKYMSEIQLYKENSSEVFFEVMNLLRLGAASVSNLEMSCKQMRKKYFSDYYNILDGKC